MHGFSKGSKLWDNLSFHPLNPSVRSFGFSFPLSNARVHRGQRLVKRALRIGQKESKHMPKKNSPSDKPSVDTLQLSDAKTTRKDWKSPLVPEVMDAGPLPSSQAAWPISAFLPEASEILPAAVAPVHIAPKPSKKMARSHEHTRGAEVRQVRRRGASIYTGDVPMPRLGGKLLSGEGFIEIHWHIVLDFHFENLVAAYAQPMLLDIWVLGEKHTWTPDVLVVDSNGVETLIEVKPLEFMQPDEEKFPSLKEHNRLVCSAWEAAATKMGYRFMLITEDDARLEPRFHNAKMMFRAHGSNITEEIIEEGFGALRCLPAEATVRELATAMPRFGRAALMVACILDRRGYIRLDRRDFFSPRCKFVNRTFVRNQPATLVEVAK